MVRKLTRTETGHHFIVIDNWNQDTEWTSLKKFYKDAVDEDFEMWCGVYSAAYTKWVSPNKKEYFESIIEELIDEDELVLGPSSAVIVVSEAYGCIKWIAELADVGLQIESHTSKTFIGDDNEAITVWEMV